MSYESPPTHHRKLRWKYGTWNRQRTGPVNGFCGYILSVWVPQGTHLLTHKRVVADIRVGARSGVDLEVQQQFSDQVPKSGFKVDLRKP